MKSQKAAIELTALNVKLFLIFAFFLNFMVASHSMASPPDCTALLQLPSLPDPLLKKQSRLLELLTEEHRTKSWTRLGGVSREATLSSEEREFIRAREGLWGLTDVEIDNFYGNEVRKSARELMDEIIEEYAKRALTEFQNATGVRPKPADLELIVRVLDALNPDPLSSDLTDASKTLSQYYRTLSVEEVRAVFEAKSLMEPERENRLLRAGFKKIREVLKVTDALLADTRTLRVDCCQSYKRSVGPCWNCWLNMHNRLKNKQVLKSNPELVRLRKKMKPGSAPQTLILYREDH